MSVEVFGDGRVSARLRGLAYRLRDPSPFFDRVEEILLEQSRRRWRANGYGWSPLKDATRAAKGRSKDARVRANASRILRATGALERALTVKGAPGQKLARSPDSLEFGFYIGGEAGRDVYYGQFAQQGRGEAKRVVLKKTPATQRDVNEALRDHLGLTEG
jgi:hypothetical protein